MNTDPDTAEIKGFDSPTSAPTSAEEAARWQIANRAFWENTPMRYDWKQSIAPVEFSAEFYQEIDERFLADACKFIPWKSIPFDALIDFETLKQKDVLEIGVGCGTHAQLLATHARSFTGIDLTNYAVNCTAIRMAVNNIDAKVLQMDAEKMAFADNSFDFIWSWGVIHHSANTRQVLSEMNRVLRPGGKATVMVYHRSWWNYYVLGGLFHGILRGQLFREKSIHRVLQRTTDGALARFYTAPEWRTETAGLFYNDRIGIYGAKSELFPLPAGRVKSFAMSLTPNGLSRLFTNTLRFGNFLVAEMTVTKG